ncbi:MAG: hypothetical protein ACRDPV_00160 [Gaiellaceae bacterium]
MSARAQNLWPLLLALGVVFIVLNLVELAFLDGGWPQIVGIPLGIVLVGIALARRRGWSGVRG